MKEFCYSKSYITHMLQWKSHTLVDDSNTWALAGFVILQDEISSNSSLKSKRRMVIWSCFFSFQDLLLSGHGHTSFLLMALSYWGHSPLRWRTPDSSDRTPVYHPWSDTQLVLRTSSGSWHYSYEHNNRLWRHAKRSRYSPATSKGACWVMGVSGAQSIIVVWLYWDY